MKKYSLGGLEAELNEFETNITNADGIPLSIPRRYDEVQPEDDAICGGFFSSRRANENYSWQIYYHFTGDTRNPHTTKGQYGEDNMTFRRLFLILIKMNGGQNFIDDYIKTILPYTYAGRDLDRWLDKAESEISESYFSLPRTRSGELDRRYKRLQRQHNEFIFSVSDEIENNGRKLSKDIKNDIVGRAMVGQLPLLSQRLSKRTIDRRAELKLFPLVKYFATGQFIDNLRITMRFEVKKDWDIGSTYMV